jgi:hypothetical protein
MYRAEFYLKNNQKSKKYSKKLLTFLRKSCIIFLPLLAEALFSCEFTEKEDKIRTTGRVRADKREVHRPHQEAVK